MIYGEKFLSLNEGEHFGFTGETAEINKELDNIYKEEKAKMDKELEGSRAAFKAEDYAKAKQHCNNTIKHANNMINRINKINTTKMNGIGRAKRNKYIHYATYMMDDAKVAIEEADKRMKNKGK